MLPAIRNVFSGLFKSATPQPNAPQKSWYPGSVLSGGWDWNTAYRYRDLPNTPYGVATAVTASVEAFGCIQVRSGKAAAFPWQIKRRSDGEIITRSTDVDPKHPLGRAIQDARRELGGSLFSFWEYWLCIHGEAYLEPTKTDARFVAGLTILDPLYVTPIAPLNIIEGYRYSGVGGTCEYKKWEIVYDKYKHPYDPIRGLSPMEVALQWANIDRALSTEVLSYFRRSMRPGVTVSPKDGVSWDENDRPYIEDLLSNKYAGSENAHKPIILPKSADVKPFDHPELKDQDAINERLSIKIHEAYRTPRSMTGNGDASRYQANNTEDEWFFDNVTWPAAVSKAEVVQLQLMPYYDRSDEYEFEFDRSAFVYVSEAEKAKASLVRDDYGKSLISFNEARIARGEKPIDLRTGRTLQPGETTEEFYNFDGIGLVPASEVPNIWKYKLLVAPSVYNSEVVTGEPLPQPVDPNQVIPTEGGGAEQLDPTLPAPAPTLPDGSPQPAPLVATETDATKDGDTSLFVALDLTNDPALIELQSRLKQLYPNPACEWNEPTDFHITLLYAPNVDQPTVEAFCEAVSELTLPPLELRIGSLHTFDNVGEHALHFRIRRNTALLEFQAALFELAQELGIPTSPYSVPVDYKPHITMGYLPANVSAITYQNKTRVRPTCFFVNRGDTELYRSDAESPELPTTGKAVIDGVVTPKHPNQTDALAELDAWQKNALNGAKSAFVTQHIPTDAATCIRADLADCEPKSADIRSVFKKWRTVFKARQGTLPGDTPDDLTTYQSDATRHYIDCLKTFGVDDATIKAAAREHLLGVLSIKAITATQSKFEGAITNLMLGAFNEKIKRGVFVNRMMTLLTRYERMATIDAYADAGVEIDLEDFEDDEAIEANKWLDAYADDQRQYVESIADKIFEDEALTEDEIRDYKPALWWNGSVYPVYTHFLTEASKNARLEWVLGNTEKHCDSCLTLNGIVLTAKRWKSEGIAPKDRRLACGGWLCDCTFQPTKKKKFRGTLPNWRKSVELEHAHVH